MALSQKLAQFKQQQEKLQASLAKTPVARPAAAQSKAPASRKPPPAAPVHNAVPFAQRFSFATDKEKLQQIVALQRAPVGAQMKKVLDVLLETRQALLPSEIHDSCFVDVSSNKELFESLKNNVKVSFDGQRFAYKSKHDLKNKAELLVLLKGHPEGMPLSDLKDSYSGVLTDVQELKTAGDIWVLMNSDSQEDIAYPNDPKIKIKIDEDVKELVRSIEMPREFKDIERELSKAGMTPATNSASREIKTPLGAQQTQKKTKRRDSRRAKYSNAHLPELFQNLPKIN